MDSNWNCYFKNPPETITVGDKLLLLCDGEPKIKFKAPIFIDFPDKKDKYSLYVLRNLKREENFLALEVTSYRTGDFQKAFVITDGNQSLPIKDLSFSVKSVLKSSQTPPVLNSYGPFRPPLPVWYLSVMMICLLVTTAFLTLFFNRWFQRRKFIKKILQRDAYLKPSKSFVLGLRQEIKDTNPSGKELEIYFKKFLEDLFLIPAIAKTNKQIMKNLKRYHYSIYKKEGQSISQILNELSSLKNKAGDQASFLKLKKVCQEMVFILDKKVNKNDMA